MNGARGEVGIFWEKELILLGIFVYEN